jgi:hypothetical protein
MELARRPVHSAWILLRPRVSASVEAAIPSFSDSGRASVRTDVRRMLAVGPHVQRSRWKTCQHRRSECALDATSLFRGERTCRADRVSTGLISCQLKSK